MGEVRWIDTKLIEDRMQQLPKVLVKCGSGNCARGSLRNEHTSIQQTLTFRGSRVIRLHADDTVAQSSQPG